MYTDLKHGQKYKDIKPTVQITIMEHTLFPANPIFYSQNLLMDKNTHQIYSDKFVLNVLDLTQTKFASDEDKQWNIDYWAKIFKANTWEELKMLTANQNDFNTITESLYQLSQDHYVQERCRDLEEYYDNMRRIEQFKQNEEKYRKTEEKCKQAEANYKQAEGKITQLESTVSEQEATIAQLKAKLAQLQNNDAN